MARPDVRVAYDALRAEFAFLDEVLKARTEAGLTQAQLAERVGTTQSAIARLESGALKHSPSIATLQKHAKALGYRVEVKFVKERGMTSVSARTRRERGSRFAG
ncbi:MAG: helix-turn-helix transcriptional regulator [Proteobacteria bacterium]|nr:helix-turn-helix transcriptional regulator [Pseudomonadota bacterium]